MLVSAVLVVLLAAARGAEGQVPCDFPTCADCSAELGCGWCDGGHGCESDQNPLCGSLLIVSPPLCPGSTPATPTPPTPAPPTPVTSDAPPTPDPYYISPALPPTPAPLTPCGPNEKRCDDGSCIDQTTMCLASTPTPVTPAPPTPPTPPSTPLPWEKCYGMNNVNCASDTNYCMWLDAHGCVANCYYQDETNCTLTFKDSCRWDSQLLLCKMSTVNTPVATTTSATTEPPSGSTEPSPYISCYSLGNKSSCLGFTGGSMMSMSDCLWNATDASCGYSTSPYTAQCEGSATATEYYRRLYYTDSYDGDSGSTSTVPCGSGEKRCDVGEKTVCVLASIVCPCGANEKRCDNGSCIDQWTMCPASTPTPTTPAPSTPPPSPAYPCSHLLRIECTCVTCGHAAHCDWESDGADGGTCVPTPTTQAVPPTTPAPTPLSAKTTSGTTTATISLTSVGQSSSVACRGANQTSCTSYDYPFRYSYCMWTGSAHGCQPTCRYQDKTNCLTTFSSQCDYVNNARTLNEYWGLTEWEWTHTHACRMKVQTPDYPSLCDKAKTRSQCEDFSSPNYHGYYCSWEGTDTKSKCEPACRYMSSQVACQWAAYGGCGWVTDPCGSSYCIMRTYGLIRYLGEGEGFLSESAPKLYCPKLNDFNCMVTSQPFCSWNGTACTDKKATQTPSPMSDYCKHLTTSASCTTKPWDANCLWEGTHCVAKRPPEGVLGQPPEEQAPNVNAPVATSSVSESSAISTETSGSTSSRAGSIFGTSGNASLSAALATFVALALTIALN